MKNDNCRFAVIVRFESENPSLQFPPLVYFHNKPGAAARRLAALINRRAKWVPKRVTIGTRFYIADRKTDTQYALNPFRAHFGV